MTTQTRSVILSDLLLSPPTDAALAPTAHHRSASAHGCERTLMSCSAHGYQQLHGGTAHGSCMRVPVLVLRPEILTHIHVATSNSTYVITARTEC